jgi:hypothetical protein
MNIGVILRWPYPPYGGRYPLQSLTQAFGIDFYINSDGVVSYMPGDGSGAVTVSVRSNTGRWVDNPGGWQAYGDPINYGDGTVQNYWRSNGDWPKQPSFQAIFRGQSGQVVFPGVTIHSDPLVAGTAVTWRHGQIFADVSMTLAYLEHEYGHYLDEQMNGDMYYVFWRRVVERA